MIRRGFGRVRAMVSLFVAFSGASPTALELLRHDSARPIGCGQHVEAPEMTHHWDNCLADVSPMHGSGPVPRAVPTVKAPPLSDEGNWSDEIEAAPATRPRRAPSRSPPLLTD